MFIGATGAVSSASVSILTVSKPVEVRAGMVIILFANLSLNLTSVTWPPGFTEFALTNGATSAPDGAAAWKIAGGNEPNQYSITWTSAAAEVCLTCAAWSGRAISQAMSETATLDDVNDPSPVDIAAGGVTAADGDDIAVLIIGGQGNNSGLASTTTLPANYLKGIDSPSGFAWNIVWYRDNVSAGATGTLNGVVTLGVSDGGFWRTYVIALSAASASVPPSVDNQRGLMVDNNDAFQAEMLSLKAWF